MLQPTKALLDVLGRAITQRNIRNSLQRHLKLARSNTYSFGQFGEDRVVLALCSGLKLDFGQAYFIDIGAFHPSFISNTFLLYQRGMFGINLDPSLDKIRLFHAFRPRDLSLARAVMPPGAPAVVTLATPKRCTEAASILEGNDAPVALHEIFSHYELQHEQVPTITVAEIAKLAPKGKQLAYMNIDVEGLDEVLITTMDLEQLRPHVMTVEAHLPYTGRIEALEASRTYQVLTRAEYVLMAQCAVTSVYFDGRLLERLPGLWV